MHEMEKKCATIVCDLFEWYSMVSMDFAALVFFALDFFCTGFFLHWIFSALDLDTLDFAALFFSAMSAMSLVKLLANEPVLRLGCRINV